MFGAVWHKKKKTRRGEDGRGEAPAKPVCLSKLVSSELDEVRIQARREVRG